MDVINRIRQKARQSRKTIVLPEYYDTRIVEAARIIEGEGIAHAVVLTKEMMEPQQKERYLNEYYELHKVKDADREAVRLLFEDTLYYAAMMTSEGKFDGLVAGASHTTPDMARASIRCLGVDTRITIVSSCFIMAVPNCPYGDSGAFVFADCGIIPEPNARQLACVAAAAADLASKVLEIEPRIALLSYSTKGSAKGRNVDKVTEALGLARQMFPELVIDGELQVDAAIVPEVARIKYPDSPIGGRANVLIFPDLEAGNIGYKLTQRLANARAVGPLLVGLQKPASDLSRGCIVEDIVDCAAVTAIRAQ